MPYISSVERLHLEKGVQQGILQTSHNSIHDILQVRFKKAPRPLINQIKKITDAALLRELNKQCVVIGSLEEFQELVNRQLKKLKTPE